MSFWSDQRILVTGAHGFLGSYVTQALSERGATEVLTPNRREVDLVDGASVRAYMNAKRPQVVIHLAGVSGGIGANRAEPGRFFYDNLMMGAHVIHEAWQSGAKKLCAVGTICSYPKHTPIPFAEENLWDGYPEETNAPYGLAKKMMSVQAEAYRAQYGFDAVSLLMVNLYGPRDKFDPSHSHVIAALIKKFYEARRDGADEVVVWGDGSPSREFLHARDAAEGILLATERYHGAEPVNLGAGFEITIRDLAEKIAEMMAFSGRLVWDTSKPNGQPRRSLDVSRAKQAFGFSAAIGFDEGLRETIDWYVAMREKESR